MPKSAVRLMPHSDRYDRMRGSLAVESFSTPSALSSVLFGCAGMDSFSADESMRAASVFAAEAAAAAVTAPPAGVRAVSNFFAVASAASSFAASRGVSLPTALGDADGDSSLLVPCLRASYLCSACFILSEFGLGFAAGGETDEDDALGAGIPDFFLRSLPGVDVAVAASAHALIGAAFF